MPSSGVLRRVALVRNEVLEERIASIIRVTRIGGMGRKLAVVSNQSTPILLNLMMEAIHSSETSVLTRATQHNITEDDIIQCHRRENLKS
jgi:hypothetical protein